MRLSVTTPPQSHSTKLQRGIHFYPPAHQQQNPYSAFMSAQKKIL